MLRLLASTLGAMVGLALVLTATVYTQDGGSPWDNSTPSVAQGATQVSENALPTET